MAKSNNSAPKLKGGKSNKAKANPNGRAAVGARAYAALPRLEASMKRKRKKLKTVGKMENGDNRDVSYNKAVARYMHAAEKAQMPSGTSARRHKGD